MRRSLAVAVLVGITLAGIPGWAGVALGMLRGDAVGWTAAALGGLHLAVLTWLAARLASRAIGGRLWPAAAAGLCLLGSAAGFLAAAAVLFAAALRSEDGFADDLELPEGLALSLPLADPWRASPATPPDRFRTALLEALQRPGRDDASFTPDLSHLIAVRREAPHRLDRYLAAHPGWRVFRERGRRFATRRLAIGSRRHFTLHGYYSDSDLGGAFESSASPFQTRFTIGLSGAPWYRGSSDSSFGQSGERITPRLTRSADASPGLESHCVLSAGDLVVEIFEESADAERRLTVAATGLVNEEMRGLRGADDWPAVRTLLGESAVRTGPPSLVLYESYQPGIYDSEIWVNPGEPGRVRLRAWEITREYPLSADRLAEASNEWVGWSEDPRELFYANALFTIYEGDWGKPYAARFELWFTPDAGGPERRLLEESFQIEGWQR